MIKKQILEFVLKHWKVIAIVLLAIIFDRITQSYGEKIQERIHNKKN